MKILYINYVMNQGGIENFIMSASRELVKNNDVSFLTIINSDDKFYYEDEISKMGCKIYKLNKDNMGVFKFILELVEIFKKNKFDIVHSNIYVASGYIMFAAWLANVKVRITHSHSSYTPNGFKQAIDYKIAKILIKLFSTKKIACSVKAGKALFGNSHYEIIENGISINKFKFDNKVRQVVREKNGIKFDEIVIGHIGRFVPVKNHKFLVDIFNECLKVNENMKLLLVGDGEEKEKISSYVKDLNIEKKVIFIGSVPDSSIYYNAMDVFVFPSLFEGLPYALVEAQVNGLNIITSDRVSKDAKLIDNVTFLSLNTPKKAWVNLINEKCKERNFDFSFFEKSYFNIDNMLKKLEEIYKHN